MQFLTHDLVIYDGKFELVSFAHYFFVVFM